jgi:hypothetical protein
MSRDTIFEYANEINSCNLEKSEHFKLLINKFKNNAKVTSSN